MHFFCVNSIIASILLFATFCAAPETVLDFDRAASSDLRIDVSEVIIMSAPEPASGASELQELRERVKDLEEQLKKLLAKEGNSTTSTAVTVSAGGVPGAHSAVLFVYAACVETAAICPC